MDISLKDDVTVIQHLGVSFTKAAYDDENVVQLIEMNHNYFSLLKDTISFLKGIFGWNFFTEMLPKNAQGSALIPIKIKKYR